MSESGIQSDTTRVILTLCMPISSVMDAAALVSAAIPGTFKAHTAPKVVSVLTGPADLAAQSDATTRDQCHSGLSPLETPPSSPIAIETTEVTHNAIRDDVPVS